jgi:hypothetical protein
VDNPGDNMRNERNGEHPPENRMKPIEPLEDAAGKRIPRSKKADETEKTLARSKHHQDEQEIDNRRVKNYLMSEEIRLAGWWQTNMYYGNHEMQHQEQPESHPVIGMKPEKYAIESHPKRILSLEEME